jgi:hypothetical protein
MAATMIVKMKIGRNLLHVAKAKEAKAIHAKICERKMLKKAPLKDAFFIHELSKMSSEIFFFIAFHKVIQVILPPYF